MDFAIPPELKDLQARIREFIARSEGSDYELELARLFHPSHLNLRGWEVHAASSEAVPLV